MKEVNEQVIPAKCKQCDKPMSSPLVCDWCHAVDPAGLAADYFTLLDVPRRFDIDEQQLYRNYLALTRHAHPDLHANDTAEVQQLHLRISANVNDAYRALKDPASRAAYLLQLLGGKSSADDKSVPDGFLGTMMMLQEEVEDAQGAGNDEELARLDEVLTTQRDGLLHRIAGLFEEHQQAVICEATRKDLLDEIRKQLNAVSYAQKLLSLSKAS